MANKTIGEYTENTTPNRASCFVEIEDRSDLLNLKTRRVSLENISRTGHAYYADTTHTSGTPLNVTNELKQITINGLGLTTEKAFLPAGVTDFWDSTLNKIVTENTGDAYVGRLDFNATPNTADAYFDLFIDIGTGPPIYILKDIEVFPKGTGVEQPFSLPIPFFTLATFLTNGGKLYLNTTSGAKNIDFYDIGIWICRVHCQS